MFKNDTLAVGCRTFKEFKLILGFGLASFAFCLLVTSITPASASSATISLNPNEGSVGTGVTVEGSGFSPLAEVTIEFEEDYASTSPSPVYTDDQGEFTVEFEIPQYTSVGNKTVTATDNSADASSASSVFQVLNTAPVADSQASISIVENSSQVITLTASDINGDILTFFITGNPSHGTLSDFDADSGELTYTPDLGYSGSDSFSFGVNDGDQESNTAMVSIYIGGDNNPPAAYDMFFGIVEDSFLEITLQGSDIDGDDLIFTVVGNPSHGTLDGVAPDLVYVPSANYAGLDYFTFSVNDGSADSIEPGTIEIAIDAVNDPPVAFNKSVSVSKNSLKAITLSATDADGDPLSYTIVSQPEHGTLTSYPPNLSYRADEGYTGSDSLKFVASDAVADSNVATVSITIISKAENDDYDDYYDEDYDDSYYDHYNSAPIANSQNVSGTEDTPLKLKLSATDADDDYPGFEIADYPSHGNLSDFDVELGTLVYRPSAEYSGSDSFTFRAIDNFGESELATVWVSIAAVNDPPKAIGQEFTTSDNKTAITLTAFDAEGDPMNYTILSKPVHGTLTGTAPNFVYGVIDPDFAGEDSFTFIVSDGESDTIGAVLITIVDPTEFSEDTDAVGDHERAGDGASAPSSGPSGHNSNNGNDGASTRIHVEKGNTIVQLSWEHNHQASGAESTLNLQFSDRMTRLPLGGHIWYDLVILDHDNKEIVSKQDLIALNSADIQKVAFPENAVYRIEVIVKGVIDKSNNSVTQDGAYTGRAIGIVVVPEFNSAWLMIVAATVMSSAIVTFRFASKSRR